MSVLTGIITIRHTASVSNRIFGKVNFAKSHMRKRKNTHADPAMSHCSHLLLSDFINLTQVHNFTVSAQDIFTFRRLSVITVSFTGILQLLMQIMKRFVPSY